MGVQDGGWEDSRMMPSIRCDKDFPLFNPIQRLLIYLPPTINNPLARTFQSHTYTLTPPSCSKLNYPIMSRGRSERKDRNYQVQALNRRDPFQEMHQIMRSFGGFGGFGRDDFLSGGLAHFDPMKEMMDFSSAHRNLHGQGNGGSYVCQTYVSSSTMGPDGKMQQQSYFENSAGQNKNGQTISQKQQAYRNSDGVKRIAEERMLNDRGHKVVKEKRGDQVEQTNHYYNLEDHQADRFHQDWRGANQEMKFLENVGRVQQSIGNGHYRNEAQRGIGYEPRREERRQQQLLSREQEGSRQEQQSRGSASQKSSVLRDTRDTRRAY